ncbi:hypothetical protein J7E73_01045 [Paenibacillus albidus]|uniref:hypothetical protein n=1 Tax=Paenibacillus albidus TaxID=2041023 RepID=UPI001BE61596|nr:hypothetical protein [Paenibacillus albidus]MBT2287732.1 hypothetical protein [Paenibacillus albidus]
MSELKLPSITPMSILTREEAIGLILSSFAMEELGLSQILHAEGEGQPQELEALPEVSSPMAAISGLLSMNEGIRETLQGMLSRKGTD